MLSGRARDYRVRASDMLIGNPVHASLGVLFNRAAALEVGGYNENFWPIADYVFSVRYGLAHGIVVTNRQLARYRFSQNESLKMATMALSVKRSYEFRQAMIRALYPRGVRPPMLDWLNRRQAWIDSFDAHSKSESFDWRQALHELGVPHDGNAPGRAAKAIVKLGWRMVS